MALNITTPVPHTITKGVFHMKKMLLLILVIAAIALGYCYHKGTGPFEKTPEGTVVVKEEVKQKAAEVKDKVVEKAAEVKEVVKEKAPVVKEKIAEKAAEVKDKVVEKAAEVKEAVKERISGPAPEAKPAQ